MNRSSIHFPFNTELDIGLDLIRIYLFIMSIIIIDNGDNDYVVVVVIILVLLLLDLLSKFSTVVVVWCSLKICFVKKSTKS